MQKMYKIITVIIIALSALFGLSTYAQETTNTIESNLEANVFDSEYHRGTVIDIHTNDQGFTQYITQLDDKTVIDIDTYGEELHVGSKIFVEHFIIEGESVYNFITVNRNTQTLILTLFLVALVLYLIPKKGWRAILSLGLSLVLLLVGLTPLLLAGHPPILVTTIFGILVLSLSIFITHGINRQSLISFLGSLGSIVISIILLEIIIAATSLTGFINEEIQFLALDNPIDLNLIRIVSASIIIGILGVLDDITITQVAVVRELSSDTTLTKKNIFTKALRVGQDHISSLINTLVFAYVGATLPMIMFISLLDIPFHILISQEFIFIEIVRSLVGAIALALAVPVTTWLASFVFLGSIKKDAHSIESCCAHGHNL